MRPTETLESMTTPDGLKMVLRRRDNDYFLLLDGEELMSSRAPGSEQALAELALAELSLDPKVQHPRVLIGGLGIGFTLRAALDAVSPKSRVTVAEVFPQVVEWNRRHLSHLHGRALGDHRARVIERDVWKVIRDSAEASWDAILLDVDNGPDAFCLEANSRIYGDAGLEAIRRALSPNGVLGVWSATPDRNPRFLKQLRRHNFEAHSKIVRSRGHKGNRHAIFLARPVVWRHGRKQRGKRSLVAPSRSAVKKPPRGRRASRTSRR